MPRGAVVTSAETDRIVAEVHPRMADHQLAEVARLGRLIATE
jgi:hypothetical protein